MQSRLLIAYILLVRIDIDKGLSILGFVGYIGFISPIIINSISNLFAGEKLSLFFTLGVSRHVKNLK